MNTPTRLAGLAGIAVLTALLAACSAGSDTAPAATGGTPATQRPAAVQTQPAPAPAPAVDDARPERTPAAPPPAQPGLRDGTHEARITGVAAAGRVAVDVVELLTGAEAARAAAHAGAVEVPPMNDYYIRNVNPLLRTLSVAPNAPITVNVHGSAESGSSTTDISKTLPELAAIPSIDQGLFRLTVDGGRVTRIAEVYLP